MAAQETNITTENQVTYRDVKRNTSNQIVSYTLNEDDTREYGVHKLKAVTTKYNIRNYNKTVGELSGELKTPFPDIPLEIINQNFIDESKIYVSGVSIKSGEDPAGFDDQYSGRYELTPSGASYRGAESPGYYDNTHFSGISYHNGDVRGATDNFILFPGFKEVLWDSTVYGPPLENGGYRVTKELIESGANLNLRAVIGFSLQKGSSALQAKVRILRKRIPNDPENVVEGPNGGTYTSPKWPNIQIVLDIPNQDLVEHDLYEIQTLVDSRNDGVHIMGDKCIFEVTATLPEDDPINWPPPPIGSAPNNSGATNYDEAEETTGATR